MQQLTKTIFISFSLTVLGACAPLGTQLSETDIPDNWQGPVLVKAATWPERDWWVQFESKELIDLVEQVEESNLDLAINRNNLRKAQLTMIGAGFDLWPNPNLSIGNTGFITGIGTGSSSSSNNFLLNASIEYNGILSKYSDHQLALANYDSAQAAAADTVLSTLGTTANAYFQLLFIRDQIKTAEQNLASAKTIARITQSKVFDLEAITLTDIVVPQVQPGIPSDLLIRRPDLVEAEANLRSAKANVDLARLAFLPSISLTVSSGSSNSSLRNILRNPDPISITANLVQTIFDNGARLRNEEETRLALENSLLIYRKVVLKAFNDVDVALGNIRLLDAQAKTAKEDLARATEAFRISEVQYREGALDFQTVLSTQQTLYSIRDNYLNNKLSRLNAIVAFYQTLGGGWEKELLLIE